MGGQPKAYASIVRFRSYACLYFVSFVSLIWNLSLCNLSILSTFSDFMCWFLCKGALKTNSRVTQSTTQPPSSGWRCLWVWGPIHGQNITQVSWRDADVCWFLASQTGCRVSSRLQFWERKIAENCWCCCWLLGLGCCWICLFRKLLGSDSIWYVQIPSQEN